MLPEEDQLKVEKALGFISALATLQIEANHLYVPAPEDPNLRSCTPMESALLDVFITGLTFGRRVPDEALKLTQLFEQAFALTPTREAAYKVPEEYEIQTLNAINALLEIMA